jgi:hypothetical protein
VIVPFYDKDVETDCGFKIRQFPFPGPDLHSDTNLIITTEVKELRACAEAKGKL